MAPQLCPVTQFTSAKKCCNPKYKACFIHFLQVSRFRVESLLEFWLDGKHLARTPSAQTREWLLCSHLPKEPCQGQNTPGFDSNRLNAAYKKKNILKSCEPNTDHLSCTRHFFSLCYSVNVPSTVYLTEVPLIKVLNKDTALMGPNPVQYEFNQACVAK